TEALRCVVVGGAHLHGGRPVQGLVVGVGEKELNVPVPRAVVAEERPEQVDAPEVRASRRVVDGNPLVVDELARLVGARGEDRIGPGRARVERARDGRDLAAALRERVAQARVVDDRAAGEAEAAVGALARAEVEAGIAARGPADGLEARERAPGPGLPLVRRAVEERDRHSQHEGARAGQRDRRPGAERLRDLVVRAGYQDPGEGVARDGGLVLLVLWEELTVIEVDQEVARHSGALRGSQKARGRLSGSGLEGEVAV